ncbi:hypothetical protein C725_1588 [Pacificimonas flava]|uniref:Uncharacterized protein n=1 Tax=Pacificimonas flava TaxID=1234595 RepID=M2SC91_9SPHN|nr:hypothetical protein C725_1588 [Pacificimonas flava]
MPCMIADPLSADIRRRPSPMRGKPRDHARHECPCCQLCSRPRPFAAAEMRAWVPCQRERAAPVDRGRNCHQSAPRPLAGQCGQGGARAVAHPVATTHRQLPARRYGGDTVSLLVPDARFIAKTARRTGQRRLQCTRSSLTNILGGGAAGRRGLGRNGWQACGNRPAPRAGNGAR